MKSRTKTAGSGLPFVFLNMAMTADGKIATANRAVHSFGGSRDLEHLYELRATADAVMCGARTIEISQSILDPGDSRFRKRRLECGLAEYNLRIIVSGTGSIDAEAAIFKSRFSPVIVLTTGRTPQKKLAQLRELADAVKVCGEREIDFRRALRWLRAEWNVKRLLCEGGGALNAALFRAHLVDEIHLTVAQYIFGGRRAPTIADGEKSLNLAGAVKFKLQTAKLAGDEMFAVFNAVKPAVV